MNEFANPSAPQYKFLIPSIVWTDASLLFAKSKLPAGESMAMYQYASVKDRAQAVKKNFDDAVTATG